MLDESAAILRAERGVLICRTRHGFVCANAGVDASNARRPRHASCCCRAIPTRSARALRAALARRVARVVIADSFGRAWRNGQGDVAIGIAGLRPLDDWRGRDDARPRAAGDGDRVADEAAQGRLLVGSPEIPAPPGIEMPAGPPLVAPTLVQRRVVCVQIGE